MLLSSTHSRPRYTGLIGSSDALALAQYAAQSPQGGRRGVPNGSAVTLAQPLAVIAANAQEAQRLVEEIPFFDPELRVHLLPDWETLPYDHFSPHQDLISERLATLHHVRSQSCDVLVVPVTTALYPLPPVEYLAAFTFFLKRGEKLDQAKLREQLTFAGYSHVQQVLSPGEYCVRGGIIDLFAMGSVLPYRIDLFDDEIETIATFDVDTQRSLYPVPEIRLLPAREFPLDEAGQSRFRQSFRERFEGDPSRSYIYKNVSKVLRAHRHAFRLFAEEFDTVPAPRCERGPRRFRQGCRFALQPAQRRPATSAAGTQGTFPGCRTVLCPYERFCKAGHRRERKRRNTHPMPHRATA
jgi:transcription-repair coupling factor (superfamily II helicase)